MTIAPSAAAFTLGLSIAGAAAFTAPSLEALADAAATMIEVEGDGAKYLSLIHI